MSAVRILDQRALAGSGRSSRVSSLRGDREVLRAADRQRGREPCQSLTYQAVNLPSSAAPAPPDLVPLARRADVLHAGPVGEVGPEVRHDVVRLPACRACSAPRTCPWLKATSQCSIRSRRPWTTLSYSAMSPAAKTPGALVSRNRSVSTPLSVSMPGLLGQPQLRVHARPDHDEVALDLEPGLRDDLADAPVRRPRSAPAPVSRAP